MQELTELEDPMEKPLEMPEATDLKIAWELMEMCSMKHTQEAIN